MKLKLSVALAVAAGCALCVVLGEAKAVTIDPATLRLPTYSMSLNTDGTVTPYSGFVPTGGISFGQGGLLPFGSQATGSVFPGNPSPHISANAQTNGSL